jgi:hypothetical protein
MDIHFVLGFFKGFVQKQFLNRVFNFSDESKKKNSINLYLLFSMKACMKVRVVGKDHDFLKVQKGFVEFIDGFKTT